MGLMEYGEAAAEAFRATRHVPADGLGGWREAADFLADASLPTSTLVEGVLAVLQRRASTATKQVPRPR